MTAAKRRRRKRLEAREMSDPNPEPETATRKAFVVYKDKPAWRMVECDIPHDVMMRYATKVHEPDGSGMVLAKLEAGLLHLTAGRK